MRGFGMFASGMCAGAALLNAITGNWLLALAMGALALANVELALGRTR